MSIEHTADEFQAGTGAMDSETSHEVHNPHEKEEKINVESTEHNFAEYKVHDEPSIVADNDNDGMHDSTQPGDVESDYEVDEIKEENVVETEQNVENEMTEEFVDVISEVSNISKVGDTICDEIATMLDNQDLCTSEKVNDDANESKNHNVEATEQEPAHNFSNRRDENGNNEENHHVDNSVLPSDIPSDAPASHDEVQAADEHTRRIENLKMKMELLSAKLEEIEEIDEQLHQSPTYTKRTPNPLSLSNISAFYNLQHSEENALQFTPKTELTINRLGFQPQDLLDLSNVQKQEFILQRQSIEAVDMLESNDESDEFESELNRHPGQLSLQLFKASKEKKINQLLNWIQSEHDRLAQIEDVLESWENKKQRTSKWKEIRHAISEERNKTLQRWSDRYNQMIQDEKVNSIKKLEENQQNLEEACRRRKEYLEDRALFLKSKREFIEKIHKRHSRQLSQLKDEKERENYEKEFLRALKVHSMQKKQKEIKAENQRRKKELAQQTYERYEQLKEQKEYEAIMKKADHDKKYKEYCKKKEAMRKEAQQLNQEKERERAERKRLAEEQQQNLEKEYLRKIQKYEARRKELEHQQKIHMRQQKIYAEDLEKMRQRTIAKAERMENIRINQIMDKNRQIDERLQEWDALKQTLVNDVRYNNSKMEHLIAELTEKVQVMVSSGRFNVEELRKYMQQLREEKSSVHPVRVPKSNSKTQDAHPRYMEWVTKQAENKEKERRSRPKTASKNGVREMAHHRATTGCVKISSTIGRPKSAYVSRKAKKSKSHEKELRPQSALPRKGTKISSQRYKPEASSKLTIIKQLDSGKRDE